MTDRLIFSLLIALIVATITFNEWTDYALNHIQVKQDKDWLTQLVEASHDNDNMTSTERGGE